jgi:multicomponent K+:H+ antiporter subunit E
MRRWLPFPLLWALLLAMWLLLNRTLAPGDVILGALVAFAATLAFSVLQSPQGSVRRPAVVGRLLGLVLADVVRSNIAVARIVMHPGTRHRVSGFVTIPLELRDPAGLAALACIITATPGTAWARYDSSRGMLTIHVLDLVDETSWIRIIKDRYERRLLEIFE